MPGEQRRWPWIALAVAAGAFILSVTLLPSNNLDTGTFHTCVLCGELGLSDFIGNIVLFMPLAAALYLAGVPGRKTIALLFALSGSIELAQLWIPGRESAFGDLVSNTLGAAAGVGFAHWVPRRARSARAGFAAAAGAIVVMAAICAAFAPSFPRSLYYGQWTPDLGQYETYQGRVLSAEIAGMAMPSWRLKDSKAVRRALLAGEGVRVSAVAGPPPAAPSPVFNIYDQHRNEILFLGADGRDLVTHVRLLATDLLLRQPDLRWRGALDGVKAGDTLRLGWRRGSPGYCLALNGRERCGLAYTVGEAWGLIQFPPGLSRADHVALGLLFMAGLGLAAGLFPKRDAAGVTAIGLVLVAAVALPALTGLAPTPLAQLAALAAGLFGGARLP